MRARSDRRSTPADEHPQVDARPPEGPNAPGPGPLLTTRALLIILVALVAAGVCAAAPEAAIPIGVGVGVVTLLAQIVKDD